MYTILIGVLFLIINIIFCFNIQKKKNKITEDIIRAEDIKVQKAIQEIKRKAKDQYDLLQKTISDNERIIANQENQKKALIENQKEIVAAELALYKKEEEQKIQQSLTETQKEVESTISVLLIKRNEIAADIEDFQQRRFAINEAILREKEIQEREDFYKIVISENDKEDIARLMNLANSFNRREAIYKLIYEVFVKRPLDEMIKRVLNGKAPSGIYKITYLPTGESYIGKSTNVKTRWTNHIKTACGLDGAAKSSLHTKMAKDGLWNFSFELLEEVDKDLLSEREKFYIDLYDTKNSGLNIKAGG